MTAAINFLTPFFSPSTLLSFGAAGVLVWFGLQWPGLKLKVLAIAAASALVFHGIGYVRGDHAGSARVHQQWDAANARIAAAAKKRDDDIAAAALKAATEALAEIESLSKEQLERITEYAAELARAPSNSCRLTRDDFERLRKIRNTGTQRSRHR